MTTRYVRIVAHSKSTEYPLYLDAPIETVEGVSKIAMKAILFGFFGDIDGNFDPFILRREKSTDPDRLPHLFDFGTNWNGVDRFGGTNLLGKSIDIGQQFSVRFYNGEENVYSIKQITDLVK